MAEPVLLVELREETDAPDRESVEARRRRVLLAEEGVDAAEDADSGDSVVFLSGREGGGVLEERFPGWLGSE